MKYVRKFESLFWRSKTVWNTDRTVGLDVQITPSLWVEGRWNELRRWYMDQRKNKNLKTSDPFWKLFI